MECFRVFFFSPASTPMTIRCLIPVGKKSRGGDVRCVHRVAVGRGEENRRERRKGEIE